jgi:hypothetical protein
MKKINTRMIDISKIIGIEGGHDATYYKVLGVEGEGVTSYWPSIKDGEILSFDHPEYWDYKVKRTRRTVRVIVAGNAVCAEEAIRQTLGCKAMATQPYTVEIYPES